MVADPRLGFLGRKNERERLDALLAKVRNGESAGLVIRGEAGVGKTALLRYTARQAAGMRVAQIAGVQAEMELPFAGIHRLCAPMLARLDALPEPQRRALNVALGVTPGEAPNRFLVALAVLSLFGATAAERPLLCLVDDAQWLDDASVQALGFVARRLLAESVAIVFALRRGSGGDSARTFAGLPELSLEGLEEADAHALLSAAVPGRLDDRVRERIIAETHGNPLALLELARGMSAAERAAGYALPAARDLSGRVEGEYLRRVRALPEATQRLMLLAAADSVGNATLVWRAAENLSIDPSSARPAADAGLLEIDDEIRFRHPLVRSAVYRGASSEDRRRVHEALAEVSDSALEADRRAWHRALAAAGPDAAVAAELERSAERAQMRGGLAATAAFLERATALTPDPELRSRRALAAAQASVQTGAFEPALAFVARAEAEPLDELQRAEADVLRGQVAFASGRVGDAAELLLRAARRFEPFDLQVARQTYLTALGMASVAAHHVAGAGVLREICRAVQALPAPAGAPRPLDLLLDGVVTLNNQGRAAAAPTLQRAARALVDISLQDTLHWGWVATGASVATWDDAGYLAITTRMVQLLRNAGALAELPLYLGQLARARAWVGDFAGAASLIAEGDSVAAATGGRFPPYSLLSLQALQGREPEVTATIASAIERADRGAEGMASHALLAAAVLYNGLARHEEAASAARQVAANTLEPWYSMWALPELVEAAARAGDAELTRDALQRLAETTQPCVSDFARGLEARCRALASDSGEVELLYREAIDHLSRTPLKPELARTHLLFGEWLRRETRDADAREQLRTAYDVFVATGMEAFAERARRELAAAGATVRLRTAEARDELTAQEQQIARLARDGLTNSEIGSHVFLSPRTVEWHLHRVFVKLGIDSRSGLNAALPSRAGRHDG